jgi:Domain of unknown function (DUF4276)
VKVIVYVEGPSDKRALEALLKPIIDVARKRGVGISLSPQNGKAPILNDVPRRAADHLEQHPGDWIFALPDLYPMAYYDGTPNEHHDFDQLARVLRAKFEARAAKIHLPAPARAHFRVHCLKHDLEVLLLAAPEQLRERLKTKDALRFRIPVEDQNDSRPPKRVVEDLFRKYRKKPDYVDTEDAVWVLERASLDAVVSACAQRFAPFVRELRGLAEGRASTGDAAAGRGRPANPRE